MRVFVTGAGGFIGRALSDALTRDGVAVTGVDLVADDSRGVVGADITDSSPWAHLLEGVDCVVHTAAAVSNAVSWEQGWRANVVGTHEVVHAAARAGVGRVVVLSSVRAFGDTGFPDGVSEDHPVRPDGNVYVDTKIGAEQVALQAHAAGLTEVVVVRPGDVYGPGSRPWTLLPLELIRRRSFAVPARGRGVFSPVFIDDLVEGVGLTVRHPDAGGEVFTLSGGVGVSTAEFFGHYHRMLGTRGPVCLPTSVSLALAAGVDRAARAAGRSTEVNPTSMRYFTRTGTYSIEKARRVLGYEPQVGLEAGMALTEAWLREQGLLPRH